MSDTLTGTSTRRPTRWVGLIVFAGILMLMQGLFQAIAGLAALVNDDYYQTRSQDLVFLQSYTAWGWVHLLLGVLVFLAGIGVMSGNLMARIVGVAMVALNAVVALVFASAAPVWAVIVITIDILVIYALTVHGREMERV